MKKNKVYFSLIVIQILILFLTGCVSGIDDKFSEGMFYSSDIIIDTENASEIHFSKAKYDLKYISEIEYLEKNGKNAFIDKYGNYISIQLYLLFDFVNTYSLVELTDIKEAKINENDNFFFKAKAIVNIDGTIYEDNYVTFVNFSERGIRIHNIFNTAIIFDSTSENEQK